MLTDEHFEFLQIKKFALKVYIHCDGCKQKVTKILKKIDGVYSVVVNAEQQKVEVYGNVDPTILIKKLVKSGKHAEFWPDFINGRNYRVNDTNQIQNLMRNLNVPNSQSLLTPGYPRSLEDQMSFERYLKQSMEPMENHAHIGWDDMSLIGEDGSGFVDMDGSQTYHDHQSSMPVMNMYQQRHPLPMMMNMNMHNKNMNMHGGMVHDNMYMHQPQMLNHVFPMFGHARYACYY